MRPMQKTYYRMFSTSYWEIKSPSIKSLHGFLRLQGIKSSTVIEKRSPCALDGLFSELEDGEMSDWMDILMDNSSNPETIYLRNLFQETLKESLDELPEEQKQAFVLNEIEGIPFKQISEETGVPVNTLISRKRYAVLHLRMKLSDLHEALKNY